MDFNFSEEQKQLADALRRFCAKEYDFETRKAIIASESGVSGNVWNALVELGLTALPVPEAQGGFGGGAVDMLAVMQELGRGMVVEPYFATVLGAEFLKRGGGHEALLEQVAGGELKLACALGERQSRHELNSIRTTARADGDGFVLDGVKTVVVHGAQADRLIVSARVGGDERDTAGIALFVVERGAAGVGVIDCRTNDGMRAATITLDGVRVGADAVIGKPGEGWPVLEAAADHGVTLLCAEAIGVMDALNAATLEYTKTRQQFGVPIARFQALQHRMVDMFIHTEQARSLTYLAAAKMDGADEERRRAVAAAKVRVGQAGRFVGQQAVQLHGGMGVTYELPAAHLFKRLTMIEVLLGDTDHHLARFAALPGFSAAA